VRFAIPKTLHFFSVDFNAGVTRWKKLQEQGIDAKRSDGLRAGDAEAFLLTRT
tara:strand:- start:1929 stop:2087 length:159 start_codon:yes stop_codon:yes gene_type:complete